MASCFIHRFLLIFCLFVGSALAVYVLPERALAHRMLQWTIQQVEAGGRRLRGPKTSCIRHLTLSLSVDRSGASSAWEVSEGVFADYLRSRPLLRGIEIPFGSIVLHLATRFSEVGVEGTQDGNLHLSLHPD